MSPQALINKVSGFYFEQRQQFSPVQDDKITSIPVLDNDIDTAPLRDQAGRPIGDAKQVGKILRVKAYEIANLATLAKRQGGAAEMHRTVDAVKQASQADFRRIFPSLQKRVGAVQVAEQIPVLMRHFIGMQEIDKERPIFLVKHG